MKLMLYKIRNLGHSTQQKKGKKNAKDYPKPKIHPVQIKKPRKITKPQNPCAMQTQ